MKGLKFFGAAGTVTGSCHMIIGDNGRGTLVDMGMFQGTKEIEALNRILPSFNAHEIDNVILTHAHLDHCGRLPILSRMGFAGNIYMTKATRELTELVLYDSAKIANMQKDVAPLYTSEDVADILARMKVVDYNQEFMVGKYKVVLRDAGHLLGSAIVEVNDETSSHVRKIVFSGDLGNSPDILLRQTAKIGRAEIVVMESTYGDRNHPTDDPYLILQDEVNKSENANSVLMIPAFSLERTQILLFMIKELKRKNKIDIKTQVYLDSPMGINATEIYRKYATLFNDRLQSEFREGDPFSFPGLNVTRSHKQSLRIYSQKKAKVIIAGSGMMNGGRILGHAVRNLPIDKNRLLIVGYQGDETLGRAIKDGAREVEIDGEVIPVTASVNEINNLSAHADQNRLVDWLKSIDDVQKVVLIHGDDNGPRQELKERILDETPIREIYLPLLNESLDFGK